MNREPVCILVGLTSSGKKTVGIEVARSIRAEIISLDSIKIYRGMDLGSAKPSAKERGRVPFHLLDIVDPNEAFSVGQFLAEAARIMKEIQGRERRALFLGGTAFYLNCLLNGLLEGFESDPQVRRHLLDRSEREGSEKLHALLSMWDPTSAKEIHPNDTKRIVRALEVIQIAGRSLSWLKAHKTRSILTGPARVAGLKWPDDQLKRRISIRTEKMIRDGFVEEVSTLLEGKGFGSESGKAIGYRQIIAHLKGLISLEEAVQQIKTATWRFAKKQMTWYKRFQQIRWFEAEEGRTLEELAGAIAAYFEEEGGDFSS